VGSNLIGNIVKQAHDISVRTMVWSHNDSWMVTGDHGGYVKYWQSNMNNVKMYQAHKEAIRGIRYSHLIVIVDCIYHFVAADARQPSQNQSQNRVVSIVSFVWVVWEVLGIFRFLISLVDRFLQGCCKYIPIKPSIQQQATQISVSPSRLLKF